jgi:hypothetical protein
MIALSKLPPVIVLAMMEALLVYDTIVPTCASLDNQAGILKGIAVSGGLYKALGASIVASGGTDLPESASVGLTAAGAAVVGWVDGLAAKHHIGCR